MLHSAPLVCFKKLGWLVPSQGSLWLALFLISHPASPADPPTCGDNVVDVPDSCVLVITHVDQVRSMML